MGIAAPAAVIAFGLAAVALCLRQRDPRVPFIAIIGLILLIAVSAGATSVAFGDSAP